jgi:hypothetical protein
MPVMPHDTPPAPPGQMPASGFNIQAPYDAGSLSPINAAGDPDAGGRDDVAATVAGAQAAAEARFREHMGDQGQAGHIGDAMHMPMTGLDPAASSPGSTDPHGAFYDPPRDFGG